MPGKVKWLWSINSGSNVDTSNLVTLDGTQTITGSKTFSSAIFTNGGISTSGSNIDFNSKRLSSVASPTDNTDAANKQYVDNTVYTGLTTIKNQVGNIGTLDDTWRQILDYTNMENNFRIEGQATYLVLFKENISDRDIYGSCIIGVNNANYDNVGTTSLINWGATEVNAIMFTISLKNNQFKLWAKRGSGNSSNWSTNTRIYIKKLSQGGVQ